jgi:hypothetical protein
VRSCGLDRLAQGSSEQTMAWSTSTDEPIAESFYWAVNNQTNILTSAVTNLGHSGLANLIMGTL